MTKRKPESTGPQQGRTAKGKFKPGASGNPAGRPAGARHKATMAAEAILDGEAETLTRKAVELALTGDTTALSLCLSRILPPRRDRPIDIDVPDITTPGDLVDASAAIIAAVADGRLTPQDGTQVARLIETHVKAVEAHDFEKRLTALENNPDRNQSR